MSLEAYVKEQRDRDPEFIPKICRVVRELTFKQLLELNPTMEQMRTLEYVRDIGHGHYPHYSNFELEIVVKLLGLQKRNLF